MDPLDFTVYRFLSPGGQARFWAGRRVIDPRITPREIGEAAGISERGVRTRLEHLAKQGYLNDRAVIPNPGLFGRRVFVADLPVRRSGEVDGLFRDLSVVEGVVFARDVLDEEERKIQVYFVSESEAPAARLATLVGRLSPAGRPVEPRPYLVPVCSRSLSVMDWKILSELWRHPDATFLEISENTGVSLKTAARIYHQLIDSHACWWTHGPYSEEFPLALVRIVAATSPYVESIRGWLVDDGQPWMPVAPDGYGAEPSGGPSELIGLTAADAPAVLERFLRRVAALEGVDQVHRTFALGSAIYTSWFADRLATSESRPNPRGR